MAVAVVRAQAAMEEAVAGRGRRSGPGLFAAKEEEEKREVEARWRWADRGRPRVAAAAAGDWGEDDGGAEGGQGGRLVGLWRSSTEHREPAGKNHIAKENRLKKKSIRRTGGKKKNVNRRKKIYKVNRRKKTALFS